MDVAKVSPVPGPAQPQALVEVLLDRLWALGVRDAFGVPGGAIVPLLSALHHFYPELHGARVVEERFLLRRDCPAFAPGSHALRPGVVTPHDGVALAGDFVRLPIPSALMERAVASGFLAANHLLSPYDVRPEPIRSIPRRGLLGRERAQARALSPMR